MTEKVKDIRISKAIHKKLKLQAVKNDRTIKAELKDIISKSTNSKDENDIGGDT